LLQNSRWLCTSAEKAAQELSPEQVELKKLNDELNEERKKSTDLQVSFDYIIGFLNKKRFIGQIHESLS